MGDRRIGIRGDRATRAAAMDAGNMGRVATMLCVRFPEAELVLLADNDAKPGHDTNPGVVAATAAARAVGGQLAIPPVPGDMNDLAASQGLAAVAACIRGASLPPPIVPTYKLPTLSPADARIQLDGYITRFMADTAAYWLRSAGATDGSAGAADAREFAVPIAVSASRACF